MFEVGTRIRIGKIREFFIEYAGEKGTIIGVMPRSFLFKRKYKVELEKSKTCIYLYPNEMEEI